MSRYIDADKAIEVWKDQDYIKLSSQETKTRIMLDAVPSADVVEVVRCKDCKYYKEFISNRGTAMMCFCPCCLGGQGKKEPTDYCSYGEPKEQEHE